MVGDLRGPAWQTAPASPELAELPGWVTLLRASNPSPMTLDGTNTWVLRPPGAETCVVVDPGPREEAHLAAIAAEAPIGLILITHGHPDHVAGLGRTIELVGEVGVVAADAALRRGGEPLELGELKIIAVPTPGHTTDSVSFHAEVRGERLMLTGDTILGRGTTVVAWPDGDLRQYLDSLRVLSTYRDVPVLPGHGPALADCGAAALFYLEHRRARLRQVAEVVAGGAGTPAEIVAQAYADVDKRLWPAAELSVRAQLEYLQRESERGIHGLDPP
jgi:glyoxylase-like metal-dependent hydrolase (beta-lactamase superfamily II)